MTLSHRPMEIRDADAICSFARSAEELFLAFPEASYPLTPEALWDVSRQRSCPTVALWDGEVAGYVNFLEVKERYFCAIGNLLVHPDHRRKGVATHLVKVMVRTAIEAHGVRFVRAASFSHNQKAYQLFHKLGFRPSDLEQKLTSDGTPLLVVNLYLNRKNACCETGQM